MLAFRHECAPWLVADCLMARVEHGLAIVGGVDAVEGVELEAQVVIKV